MSNVSYLVNSDSLVMLYYSLVSLSFFDLWSPSLGTNTYLSDLKLLQMIQKRFVRVVKHSRTHI